MGSIQHFAAMTSEPDCSLRNAEQASRDLLLVLTPEGGVGRGERAPEAPSVTA
jgi:hypothetical protein